MTFIPRFYFARLAASEDFKTANARHESDPYRPSTLVTVFKKGTPTKETVVRKHSREFKSGYLALLQAM